MPKCPKNQHMMPNGKYMKDSDMKKKKAKSGAKKSSKKMPASVLAMFRAMKKK